MAGQVSPWVLVREVGLDYAEPAHRPDRMALLCPVAVERVPGVGNLIVDDLSADGDPLRMQCRTLLLSFEGKAIFDSQARGIDDAYGCRMDGERLALLRGDRPDLLVLSHSGELQRRIDVSSISRHPPRLVSWTDRGTFLVAFLGGFQVLAFAELDATGRVLWARSETTPPIGIPGSLQLLPNDAILIADEFHNVVWELDRKGSASIRRGRFRHPSAAEGDLHRPRCARQLDDGTLLVCDSHNHRILAIGRDGAVSRIRPAAGELLSPSFAARLDNGHHLVCDAGNRSVLELDPAGRVVWGEGADLVRHRHLSFPRSVHYRGDGRYLVADSAHNRVVDFDRDGPREHRVDDARALFWPRAAHETPGKSLLIADGRNARVLEVAPDGRVLHQLDAIRFEDRDIAFDDPHDIRLLANGNLLIVDSAQHFVAETGWDGRAAWVVGRDFGAAIRDPHSAQPLPDGRIMIADRGNDRILFIDPRTGLQDFVAEFRVGDAVWRLNSPRYAGLAPDGTLVIVDTGNNRVLVSNLHRDFVWELSQIPGSPRPWLRLPRWAHAIDRNEIVVSDYSNHRIVHLRRRGA